MSHPETAPADPLAALPQRIPPGLFAGRVVWVTGGGSGIGRCVAHELASLGATVVVSGRTPEKLERSPRKSSADGGRCEAAAFDIRDEDAVRTAIGQVVARHGAIHGLVNNAGGQFPSPLMAISKRGFDAVVANNLTGGFLMMREVFNQSMQKHGGSIVNMTADFRNGMPGMGHSGRRPGRHEQPDDDRRLRMGACRACG